MQPYASHYLRHASHALAHRKPQRYASSLAFAGHPAGANAATFEVSRPMLDAVTHWTRIVYYDVLAPQDESRSGSSENREPRTAWMHRSPWRQAAVLVSIYIALHLAVAALLHVFQS